MVGITRRVLALPLVNIGGIDIVNGQHKLLLAILWQLMRFNIRGLLQVWPFPPYATQHPQSFSLHFSLHVQSLGVIKATLNLLYAIQMLA